jgi:multidrug resistance efflux pump
MDTETPAVDREPQAASPSGPQQSLLPPPPRHAGSDRFDGAIEVTRTRAWIGLVCCLLLVGGIVVWAITAKVGVTVKSPGVALVNGAIATAPSPVTGTVQTVTVNVDDSVQQGQIVGTVTDAQNQPFPLVAPVGGHVLNVAGDVGSTVHAGEDFISIAQTSGPLLVKLFVTPTQAEQVELGDEAVLSFPEQPEMHGRVTAIGSLPLTKDQVADSIGSPALADHLVKSGAVVSITVSPDAPKAGTPSAKVDSGDVAGVTLIVGTKRPIEYVA